MKRKPCPSEHNGHKCWAALDHEGLHWAVVQVDGKTVWVRWE